MKSKLNLECLSERITPSVGVDNPGTTGYSIPTPPAPAGPPEGVLPTNQEVIDKGNEFRDQLKAKSDLATELVNQLKANEADQAKMEAIIKDPTKTPAQRAIAKATYDLLVSEHEDLVELLGDTVAEYNRLEANYATYQSLMKDFLKRDVVFPKYQGLPSNYEQYLPESDPRLIA